MLLVNRQTNKDGALIDLYNMTDGLSEDDDVDEQFVNSFVYCCAHLLHNVVKEGLDLNQDLTDLLDHLSNVVSKCKMTQKLNKYG